MDTKRAISVDELAEALGIGRNKAYELAHSEGFPAVHLGKRVVIPIRELEAWLARQAEQGSGM